MTLPDTVASTDWFDLSWSNWQPLEPAVGALAEITTDAGLYRVRHPAFDRLVYVGETGRSTRGRVRALARGVYAEEMPYRDPHTAAPTLWAIRDEYGPELEFSWVAPARAADKQSRKGLEMALIAIHRRECGISPVGNFGRIIPGYEQSSYSRDGIRGGPLLESETEPNAIPGTDALSWHQYEEPLSDDWMGLSWSTSIRLEDVHGNVPQASGVYRIWDQATGTPLEYIGESTNLKNRIYRHRRERDGTLHLSFATLSRADARHKLLEIESELVGAHWLACEAPPRDQF